MEGLQLFSNIPVFDEFVHFWMIRAKRGFFFDEYVDNKFIAIGWNLIKASRINHTLSEDQEKELKEDIQHEYDEKLPGAALNKCLKFLNEVRAGDIAMIVGRDRIAFAKIGEYYEVTDAKLTVELEKQVHSCIEHANLKNDSFDCPYIKRRKIEIIKIINADGSVNPYLYRAMAVNRHSLSELSDYAESILSACYDSFSYGGKLSVTFRVEQKESINAFALSEFIACSAQILSCGDPSSVSVKTALHSPGDIVLQIWDFVTENAPALLMCYMAVFGGKFGNLEFNSIVSIIKDALNKDYLAKRQAIELRKLEAEAKQAEQDALTKELTNIEKIRELQLYHADNLMKPLCQAAEYLQIRPSDSTIVDIREYLRKREGNTDGQ